MDDSSQLPVRLLEHVEVGDHEQSRDCLDRLGAAPTDERKAALRRLRSAVDDGAVGVGPLADALAPFLNDEERSVRLTAAKLFVTVARADPGAVEPEVPALRARLTDEDAFYFVRARSAEALGYVALEYPDAVATPEVVAELRLGLAFDQSEVREKLAKALELVALGDPERLSHQVGNLVDHLDDEGELVRYHLCSTLAAVGCGSPASLTAAVDRLCERLTDETPEVRGRAAEALGAFVRGTGNAEAVPATAVESLRADTDAETRFLAERAQFALDSLAEADTATPADDIGTVAGIRETTADAVASIRTPDGSECRHCGVALPTDASPMCPRCGAPR